MASPQSICRASPCRKSQQDEYGYLLFAKLFQQLPYSRLASDETAFSHQPIVDPLGDVALFLGLAPSIFLQAVFDIRNDICGKYRGLSEIIFPLPWHAATVPVFLDGIAGDMECCRDLSLTHAVQSHSANLFVNLQCDTHLYFAPYIVSHYYRERFLVA